MQSIRAIYKIFNIFLNWPNSLHWNVLNHSLNLFFNSSELLNNCYCSISTWNVSMFTRPEIFTFQWLLNHSLNYTTHRSQIHRTWFDSSSSPHTCLRHDNLKSHTRMFTSISKKKFMCLTFTVKKSLQQHSIIGSMNLRWVSEI